MKKIIISVKVLIKYTVIQNKYIQAFYDFTRKKKSYKNLNNQ